MAIRGDFGPDGPIGVTVTTVVSLGAVTDIGKIRKSNQDTYCALAGDDVPAGIDALVAVADGMGGGPAGDVASALAIVGLVEGVALALKGVDSPTEAELVEVLARVLGNVNAEVYEASQESGRRGMGTTLTVAVVAGTIFVVGNVGDSRAYGASGGRIRQISVDHSWVEEQVSTGAMTREQAERHAYRNMLTMCIGPSLDVSADTFTGTLDSGESGQGRQKVGSRQARRRQESLSQALGEPSKSPNQ